MVVDTHCHLGLGELADEPLGIWERARAAGVEVAIVIGISVETSRAALKLTSEAEGLAAAVGIHPNETARAGEQDRHEIERLARSGEPRIVALGESGLDCYWDDAPLAVQEESLLWHSELSLETGLPLVLHIRDAYPRAAEVLAESAARGLRGIVHCFGGEPEELDPFLEWEWPISFSGIVTYPKARNVHEAAKRTPWRLCLVETDAPWLTPSQKRGQRNEPAFVVHTLNRLAELKETSASEAARITTENAWRAFDLDRCFGPLPTDARVGRRLA